MRRVPLSSGNLLFGVASGTVTDVKGLKGQGWGDQAELPWGAGRPLRALQLLRAPGPRGGCTEAPHGALWGAGSLCHVTCFSQSPPWA